MTMQVVRITTPTLRAIYTAAASGVMVDEATAHGDGQWDIRLADATLGALRECAHPGESLDDTMLRLLTTRMGLQS